jgi:site-specific DNA-methyltransferase (adenine-specific)
LAEIGYADACLARRLPDGRLQLIDGHLRAEIAPDQEIPVLVLDLDEAEADKLMTVLDPLAGMAEADEAALAALIGDIQTDSEALKAILDDLCRENHIDIASKEDARDPDTIPEAPESPESERNTVYVLGRHRLMCGDATRAEDVQRLVGDSKADLLLTDPPYNVAYEGKTSDSLTIANDSMDGTAFRQFLTDAFAAADRAMHPGAAFYIWHGDTEGLSFRIACAEAGWTIRQCLIWAKQAPVFGRQDYHWQHEPCLYGWKLGASHHWHSDRKQTTFLDFAKTRAGWQVTPCNDGCYTVTSNGETYIIRGDNLVIIAADTTLLKFDRPSRNADHPTMKPVALFEYLIANSTLRGSVILDTFAGSGTTLLAAEKTGRSARCMELDPRYCDVIRRRWAEFVHGVGCDWISLTPLEILHHDPRGESPTATSHTETRTQPEVS